MGKLRRPAVNKKKKLGQNKLLSKKRTEKLIKPKKNNVKQSENKNDDTKKMETKRKPKFKKGKKVASDSEESDFEIAEENNPVPAPVQEIEEDTVDETLVTREMVKKQNRKQSKSGGFQSMGLSHSIFKGVIRKGYKVPTPIQRKTIPLIMDGRDVVAMARTGSGKTAAFLIPMFEKLQVHSTKGARALILSPTRELAVQTMKFTKDLGKYTDLKFSLILGGDSMEGQFSVLHQNPDIIVATPGRFLHLLVEMDTKRLDTIEYVVFDEADRLFEMGFQEQLNEIIRRLPESRQTVLFSATLPKILVDFATAGLTDPSLIRLDVDTKISDKLKMKFFLQRHEDKTASLLHLLQTVISNEEQTVVFVSTKHHVEYLNELLSGAKISCSYIYSSLDQTARKINLAKFRKKLSMVLIVTDIAARGIDIPMLDNVINYDFPSKPKIFVHRVGRVARAGRSGTAYSFVMKDELAFLMDLHLFLGRPLKFATSSMEKDIDGVLGTVPQGVIASQQDFVRNATESNFNLTSMVKVMMNGYKQYVKSRESASVESIKRCKATDLSSVTEHPIFKDAITESSDQLSKLLSDLQKFKPNLTVFETMNTKKSRDAESIMKTKRNYHGTVIERQKQRVKEKQVEVREEKLSSVTDDAYIADSFKIKGFKKDENYIPRQSSDFHGEQGFNIKSFKNEANSATMDLTADDSSAMRHNKATKKWDRKRKKYVSTESQNTKKIKTESGSYIPASYKSKRYDEWRKRTNFSAPENADGEGSAPDKQYHSKTKNKFVRRSGNKKQMKGTLKTKDQMVKNRLNEERKKSWLASKEKKGPKKRR